MMAQSNRTMYKPENTPKVPEVKTPEVKILVEFRTRRQGGKLFHILIKGIENELPQKDACRMAKAIIRIAKEK